MKTLILTFLFVASLWGAKIDEFAKEVNYLRNYDSALKIAKKENKMIMLLLVADYCPWCKKFERKTLKNSSVSSFVSKNFIPVVVDKKRDQGLYPKEYNTPLIPTVYFIDPNSQKSLYKSVAYMKKKEYISNMNKALSVFNKKAK